MSFLWFLIIGGLAGFLAGKIMKGRGFGLLGNLGIGIVGGVLGGFLFSLFGLSGTGIMGSLITALVGAVVLIWIVNLIKN